MPAKRKRKPDVRKTTKGKGRNFRTVKEGAGMTAAGVRKYRKKNPCWNSLNSSKSKVISHLKNLKV